MAKYVYNYFDQLKVGDRQISRARTITETDLVNFSALTGDFYPLHTDIVYAAQSKFGERIAHGMLTLSYILGQLELQPGAVLAFYGIEKLRFIRPVKIGDTIHAEAQVTALQPRNNGEGVGVYQLEVKNQRAETVITATMLVLLASSPLT